MSFGTPEEQAARLLSRVVPLNGNNYGCISTHFPELNGQKGTAVHTANRAFRTIRAMVQSAMFRDRTPLQDGRLSSAVFYGAQAFAVATQRVNRNTGKSEDIVAKEIPNFERATCWWLDIDLERLPAKQSPYQTHQQAIDAVWAMCAASGLPTPSALVDSGWGLHCYWIVDQPIEDVAFWRRYACGLIALCTDHGVFFDANVVKNPVSNLRVPGTTNRKDPTQPRLVQLIHEDGLLLLQQFTNVLDTYADSPVAQQHMTELADSINPMILADAGRLARSLGVSGIDLAGDLSANMQDRPPSFVGQILSKCAAMADCHERGGENSSRNLWLREASVVMHCEDWQGWLEPMFGKHPNYDPAMCEKDGSAAAPGRCDGFQKERSAAKLPEVCLTCPFWTRITSPTQLGHMTEERRLESTDLPPGFQRQVIDGHVQIFGQKLVKPIGEEGDSDNAKPATPVWVKVFDGDVLHPRVTPTERSYKLGVTILQGKDVRVFEAQWGDLPMKTGPSAGAEARQFFAKHGLGMGAQEAPMFAQLAYDWINQGAREQALSSNNPAFGWQEDNQSFALAGQVYRPDGTVEDEAFLEAEIRSDYTPMGDPGIWQRAVEIAVQNRPDIAIGIATAFAAPLMKFRAPGGMVVSLYSPETGTGKSTALHLAQAVWGAKSGMFQIDDTENALFSRLAQLRNLPAYWDELRQGNQVGGFINAMFRVTQGREKNRLNRVGSERRGGAWHTLLVAASNKSLVEAAIQQVPDSAAGDARILEVAVGGLPSPYQREQESLMLSLPQNYGYSGVTYVMGLVEQQPHMLATLDAVSSRIDVAMGVLPEERFWRQTSATIVAGAQLAKDFGIVDLGVPELEQHLIDVMKSHRASPTRVVNDAKKRVSDTFRSFIESEFSSIVEISHYPVPGGPIPTVMRGRSDPRRLVGDMAGQITRVSRFHLRQWCRTLDVSYEDLLGRLTDMGAVSTKATLAAGTTDAGPPDTPVLVVDMSRLEP